jgi:hypothetical protein
MAMRTRRKWVGIIVVLATLLILSAGPGHTGRGGHGGGGHGHGGHGHGGHGHRWHGGHGWGGARVGIGIGLGPFWGPYWGPYWGGYWRPYAYGYPYAYPYAYPPVVTVPSTRVYVQPSAPASWYYCDNPQGYYPYVPQCPGGWRAVAPTPP